MKNGPYELVVAPKTYPGKKYRGKYAYEHHIVYWRNFNVVPVKGKVVHHKNGKKRDNRISNLELISEQEHRIHHIKPAKTIEIECWGCEKKFVITQRVYRTRKRQTKTGLYCGKSCQAKTQNAIAKTVKLLQRINP